MLKILGKKYGKELEVMEIESGLSSMQEYVGGYISIPYISAKLRAKNIDIVVNDEGKLQSLEPTLVIFNRETKECRDYIAGEYFFIGTNYDGETVSLTDEQIDFVKKEVISKGCIRFNKENGKIDDFDVLYI